MNRTDDTLLMAYADGELDAEAAREVEALLDRSPEARARVEEFRRTGALVRAAFAGVADEPVPPRLTARIGTRPRWRAQGWTALAAGIVGIAVGLGAGHWGARVATDHALHAADLQRERAAAVAAALLGRALETAPNGHPVLFDLPGTGSGSVTPVATFVNGDGEFCRRYRQQTTRDGASAELVGLACRVGVEDWRIDAALIEGAPARRVTANTF